MKINRRKFFACSAGTLAGALGLYLFAFDNEAIAGPVFTGTHAGVAINGYDTVAYFTQGKPVEGSIDHTEVWRGVTWRFASEENRALFAADPEKYAPQYGGFCAYAVAQGSKAKTEPDAFTVFEGKLYLNFDQSIKRRWDDDKAGYISKAAGYWPQLAK
jgi:YHS domain-containing protein